MVHKLCMKEKERYVEMNFTVSSGNFCLKT